MKAGVLPFKPHCAVIMYTGFSVVLERVGLKLLLKLHKETNSDTPDWTCSNCTYIVFKTIVYNNLTQNVKFFKVIVFGFLTKFHFAQYEHEKGTPIGKHLEDQIQRI